MRDDKPRKFDKKYFVFKSLFCDQAWLTFKFRTLIFSVIMRRSIYFSRIWFQSGRSVPKKYVDFLENCEFWTQKWSVMVKMDQFTLYFSQLRAMLARNVTLKFREKRKLLWVSFHFIFFALFSRFSKKT